MSERPTPFGLVFGAVAAERFPAIAAALAGLNASSADHDTFVLSEPVARLLQDIVPDDVSPDEMEAHLRLLHHAYRHWAAGAWVYRVGDQTLHRAVTGGAISSHLPRPALYLQLPAGKVWRPAAADSTPEPLDGVFVTETARSSEVAILGIFGMHRGRPGFSAVAVEAHVDDAAPRPHEVEVAAARPDGTATFSAVLQGGASAGLHSVLTGGELVLLTCRLLALMPPTAHADASANAPSLERFVDV